MGELRDGEDVDQVEEQLDWPDLGLPFTPLAQPPEVPLAHRYSPGLSRRASPEQRSRYTPLLSLLFGITENRMRGRKAKVNSRMLGTSVEFPQPIVQICVTYPWQSLSLRMLNKPDCGRAFVDEPKLGYLLRPEDKGGVFLGLGFSP